LADSSSAIPASEAKVIPFADLGPGDYFALAVRGDSMDRISPENSIILVNRRETSLLPDRAYIFSVRGEATYKLWKPKPPRLDPYSTNPANQPIFVEGRQKLLVVGRVRRTLLDL
jgi:SOS-response transcriptional repressor LexA